MSAPFTTAAATLALPVVLHTADVTDLLWHEGALWAATGGGVEVWDASGTRLDTIVSALPRARATALGVVEGAIVIGTTAGAVHREPGSGAWVPFPGTDGQPIAAILPQGVLTREGWLWTAAGLRVDLRPPDAPPGLIITDAVGVADRVVLGTLGGEVILYGEGVVRRALPGPIADLSVTPEGNVRVAWTTGAGELDAQGGLRVLADIAASGAGDLWGASDGRLLDEDGTVARLPAPIRGTLRIGDHRDALAVATADGLYWMAPDAGLRRLTPEGQVCGNFITGMARWQGRLVVATFDRGACVQQEDGTWQPLTGLPSEMINSVLVDAWTGDLLLATAEGLVRVRPDGRLSVTGLELPGAGRTAPGLHHLSVTGLAQGGDRLWITDLAGPIAVDGRGRWRRYRYHVWSTSNQRVAACGRQAWVATEDAGVSWFDGAAWQQVDALTGLPDDWIMAVACTGEGQGYAGTYQDGVWRQRPPGEGGWEELTGIPDPWILSLAPDATGLWAGTMGGLYRWEAGQGWSVGATGLPDPRVHALFAEAGGVWVGTESGLTWVPTPHDARLSQGTPTP